MPPHRRLFGGLKHCPSLSNNIQKFLAGRLWGKQDKCLQPIVSIKPFDSRWGYGWESNPGSIPIFAYST
jgi:hypothetical protein